jgi:glutamate--cysteine ligase catalytic subunit
MVVAFDEDDKDARLSLRQSEILSKLSHVCDDLPCGPQNTFVKAPVLSNPLTKRSHMPLNRAVPVFHPEYGRFMLESTPGEPYNGSVNDLLGVEGNMRFRCVLDVDELGIVY